MEGYVGSVLDSIKTLTLTMDLFVLDATDEQKMTSPLHCLWNQAKASKGVQFQLTSAS